MLAEPGTRGSGMAAPNIKLTGFELLELLGQGGMGVVWKARQLSLDRLVAIKLLPLQFGQNPENIKQIMTEARTAAKLKHPGIVQVYDASEEGGHYFFVMEYVDGYNVGQWLTRSKVLPWKDALVVAESVAFALDYAWRTSGMIHCDIKPENIMVDRDGTIKVADLGLSRTGDSREHRELTEIMGTPTYMSPEQVRGDVPLDCRTDIYSLGASLYQMITGRRLFAGQDDNAVMEQVLSSQAPDPREIVQGLPAPLCGLLERMLAKDREQRPRDWAAVIQDIRRVEKGHLPLTKAPTPGSSAMNCRKITIKETAPAEAGTWEPGHRGARLVFWLLLLLALTTVAYWYLMVRPTLAPAVPHVPQPPQPAGRAAPAPAGHEAAVARDSLHAARLWAAEHPRQIEAARMRFESVAKAFPGTPEAAQALDEVNVLARRAKDERDRALAVLTERAHGLERAGQVDEALNLVESYAGPWAAETAADRAVLAQTLRDKTAARAAMQAAEVKWGQLTGELADLAIAYKIANAQQAVSNALQDEAFAAHRDSLEAWGALLRETSQLNDRIVQSFQKEIGRTIRLRLGSSDLEVTILRVAGRRVMAESAEGKVQMSFGPEDLTPSERMARIGPDEAPEVALAKGVAALRAKDFGQAELYLGKTGPAVSHALVTRVRLMAGASAEDPAETALSNLLVRAEIPVGAYDEAAWMGAIRACRLSREQATTLNAQRERFLAEYGSRGFALKAAPVLLLLEQVCQQALEGAAPAGVSAAAPALPDQAAALAALRTRNLTLATEQVSTFDDAYGRGILVVSDAILDLSPMASLRGVRELRLESGNPRRLPLDIRPLAGTDVVALRLKGYIVKDLSALRQLRLVCLGIPGSTYAGYAPLTGLQLVDLDLSGSSIRDLTPLRGMRLENLVLDDTKISSFAGLAGMPLRRLSARGVPVHDVSPLRPLPLEFLNLAGTPVIDLQPLRGLALKTLDLSGTQIRDVAFCSSMPLSELNLSDSLVSDISGLKGKSIDRLILARAPLKDISPLEGSVIQMLDLTGVRLPRSAYGQTLARVNVSALILAETSVVNLSFLSGRPIATLSIRDTNVNDLEPLKGLPLQELDFQGTPVKDYSPLESMKLTSVWVNGEWRHAKDLLARLPDLSLINGVVIPQTPGAPGGPSRRHTPWDIERAMRDSGAL